MTDYTIKNPDGTINWAESHKARIGGGGGAQYVQNQPIAGNIYPTPQPVVNQATVRQPEPVKGGAGGDGRMFPVETVDDRIKYAQSWNLAVALFAPQMAGDRVPDEQAKKAIEYWQAYFHNKLTNK